MSDWWSQTLALMQSETATTILRVSILLIAGLVLAKIVSGSLTRLVARRFSGHQAMIAQRASFYLIIALFLISALHQLGFNLGVLLGAAGIFSVAIGFASQTSASNLISGLFLIGERSFSVGDVIRVGNTSGEVLSIDPLSVKLRTFDNLYVRIPNEHMIKSEVTTLTRYPIRRIDLAFAVGYKEDIARVRQLLFEIAERNPLCLEEPKPLFVFSGFGDTVINLQFSLWTRRENVLDLQNSIQEEIKLSFEAADVPIQKAAPPAPPTPVKSI